MGGKTWAHGVLKHLYEDQDSVVSREVAALGVCLWEIAML